MVTHTSCRVTQQARKSVKASALTTRQRAGARILHSSEMVGSMLEKSSWASVGACETEENEALTIVDEPIVDDDAECEVDEV